MKNVVLLIVCVLAAVAGFAQSHSFRDTIQVWYEQFDFDAWVMEDTVYHGKTWSDHPYIFGTPLLNDDILQFNYTDSPNGMEVIGLSAAVHYYHGRLTSNHTPEFLMLYDAMPDTFQLMAQVEWDETDTAGRPDFVFLANSVPACGSPTAELGICDIAHSGHSNFRGIKRFDIYFDKPIVVYDSFYVGGTSRGFMNIPSYESGLPCSNCSYITFKPSWLDDTTACLFPVSMWKLYHYGMPYSGPLYRWNSISSNQFLVILPIINVVDTSFANAPACPKVSGMFLRGNNTDTVTLQWAYDSLHGEFEVSYGPDGTAPGDGSVVTVNDNRWQFTDIAYSDTLMVAYVRTVCREYDTLRWSGWSSPMNFRLHYVDTTTHHEEGIEVPEEGDLSRFVRLMPNPASGSVLVMSSYGMERLEVYDARGGKVYDSPAEGTTAGFDVSSWAKGAYVVHVRTHAGTAAKRLVVQ